MYASDFVADHAAFDTFHLTSNDNKQKLTGIPLYSVGLISDISFSHTGHVITEQLKHKVQVT